MSSLANSMHPQQERTVLDPGCSYEPLRLWFLTLQWLAPLQRCFARVPLKAAHARAWIAFNQLSTSLAAGVGRFRSIFLNAYIFFVPLSKTSDYSILKYLKVS